jgi:hypothetical protein
VRTTRQQLAVDAVAMNARLDRPDVLLAQTPGDREPRAREEQVQRGRAVQPHPEAANQKTLGHDPEQDRAHRIGNAADDDIDGRLDGVALRGGKRQVEQLVGRLVEREAETLVERIGEQHGENAGGDDDQRAAGEERGGQHEQRA